MKALLQLILVSTLSIPDGFAAGKDAPRTAIAKLAQTGRVACQPTLPLFCGNIHVACSGRSTPRTFPFELRATFSHGWIESRSDTSGIKELYENGRIDWENEDAYVIFRPQGRNGYIKLLANGEYSFRHYSQNDATMSIGHCD